MTIFFSRIAPPKNFKKNTVKATIEKTRGQEKVFIEKIKKAVSAALKRLTR